MPTYLTLHRRMLNICAAANANFRLDDTFYVLLFCYAIFSLVYLGGYLLIRRAACHMVCVWTHAHTDAPMRQRANVLRAVDKRCYVALKNK
jgi:hypothetical protein